MAVTITNNGLVESAPPSRLLTGFFSVGINATAYPANGWVVDISPWIRHLLNVQLIPNQTLIIGDNYQVYKVDFLTGTFRIIMTQPGAVHAHDLLFKANAAANAVTMAANSLRNATGGDLTVLGNGADGGIRVSTVANGAEAVANAGFDTLNIDVMANGF